MGHENSVKVSSATINSAALSSAKLKSAITNCLTWNRIV